MLPPPQQVVYGQGTAYTPVQPISSATWPQTQGQPAPVQQQPYQPQLTTSTWPPGAIPASPGQPLQPMAAPQPTYAPQQYGQAWAGQYTQPPTTADYPSQQESGGKKTIVWIVLIFVLVMALAGVALALSLKKQPTAAPSNTPTTKQASGATGQTTASTSKTAQSLNDFSVVCDGGRVSNATDYTTGSSPHPIVLFEPGLTPGRFVESSVYFSEANWEADYKSPSNTQLVGCMTRKSVGDSTKTCTFENSDKQPVSLALYPVSYTLAVYEAKSGKKLTEKEVWGPATSCPYVAAYSKSDPKLYGLPDEAQVKEVVRTFVTK